MSTSCYPPEPCFTAFVAIDWADRQHFFALEKAAGGERESGSLDHRPEAIERWVGELLSRFGGGPIALALEQSRGALVTMLTQYDGLVVYPVHPARLANLRQAFFPSGAKDDPPDAALLLDLLMRHRDRPRPLELDTDQTRRLQFLVEQRRKLAGEKTRQKNRLTNQLKLYYPRRLEWFRDMDTELVEKFPRRWPTLEALQAARASTVTSFLERHHSCQRQLQPQAPRSHRASAAGEAGSRRRCGGDDQCQDSAEPAAGVARGDCGVREADRSDHRRARGLCLIRRFAGSGTGAGAAFTGGFRNAQDALPPSLATASLERDCPGDQAERPTRSDLFPLGGAEVFAPELSRVRGVFDT